MLSKVPSIAGPFFIGLVVICLGAVITLPSSSLRAINGTYISVPVTVAYLSLEEHSYRRKQPKELVM